MTEQEAIAYIENAGWSKTRLGLDRTNELLNRLGDPQKCLKFIHVAGSNGKGSSCAMFAAILQAAGYKTGLYISPHIQSFRERMQIDGELISGEELAALTEQVKTAAEAMEDHPSQFELSTAIALLYFAENACDIVVLEVGMGGALDSTNAIDAPELAVIANIGLEHTEYLGNTLEEIAATKAGIVKPGCDCVCYDGAPEVTAVVKGVCQAQNVPFTPVDFGQLVPQSHDLNGQNFTWNGKPYHLSLLGGHQLHNAALVLTGVERLRAREWNIPEETVKSGLSAVKWPARLEVLNRDPLFLLDGGHNPQCAGALVKFLDDYLPSQKFTFLLGVLADKDYSKMLDILTPYAAQVFCLIPDSPRALPAERLTAELQKRDIPANPCVSAEEAITKALNSGRPTVAFGSLYMAGAVRSAGIKLSLNGFIREQYENNS